MVPSNLYPFFRRTIVITTCRIEVNERESLNKIVKSCGFVFPLLGALTPHDYSRVHSQRANR